MNLKQKIVFITTDILVLIELTLCVYLSSKDPEYQTALFIRFYVPTVIITIFIARILFKRFGKEKTLATI